MSNMVAQEPIDYTSPAEYLAQMQPLIAAKKEELEKPIDMPNLGEKGAYEKARDDNILERHRVMSESGMFTEKELKSIKDIIVMY